MSGSATALHFGPPARRLFGTLHRSEHDGAPRGGVLLVPPFGHEAVRTHRLYRVLATRLARVGFDAFRFDPWGMGDSGGDDLDVCLEGWTEDVLLAHGECARRTGRPSVAWVGARLGATAALRALQRLATRHEATTWPRLALWDPVIDGAGYLAELRVRHVEALEASYSVTDPAWRARLADPSALNDEAIGFAIAPALRAEVHALTAQALPLPAAARVDLLLSPGGAGDARAWALRHPGQVRCRDLAADVEWTSDDSLNTALVPTDALGYMLEVLDGRAG